MGNPRDFQLVNVLLVDLVEGRKTIPVGGITPVFPVLLLFASRDRFHRHRLIRRHQRLGFKHPARLTSIATASSAATPKAGPFHRRRTVCRTQERPDEGTQECQNRKGEEA